MKTLARFFSVVFHPLFVLTYMVLVLLWTNPYSFGWKDLTEASTLLIIIFMTSVTLPAIAILMMKMLGWIDSFDMATQHERIGPYIVAGIMYLSLYLHVSQGEAFPVSLRVAVLGSLIGLWTCFFLNNFSKVSIHATAMGGLVAMVGLTVMTFGYPDAQISLFGGIQLSIPTLSLLFGTVIIAGAVCTSRLILKAHERRDVYMGVSIGVCSILIAFFILA
jgi:hypothetical protein